jgi:hypothetical protein
MKLMQFDRGDLNDKDLTRGYLLDYNDDWTLIQFVEADIYFNGYLIIRNDTIKRYREFDDHNAMVHRALRKLGYIPKIPDGIDLKDVNSIVLSVNRSFPLLVIHRELWKKDVCHIGGIADVTQKTITLAAIDIDAEYVGRYRIRSRDITGIGFGGFYETALWAVASKRTKNYINAAPDTKRYVKK